VNPRVPHARRERTQTRTRVPHAIPTWLAVAAAAVATACSGGQTHPGLFSTDWEDDRGVSIARVWERVGGAAIPEAADVAVGVAGASDKLVALSLGDGSKWTFAHPLDARPVVAGQVVVGSGGGEAFALDAKSGSVLWRRPTGGIPLLGAGDDGTVTVAAFRKAGSTGSVLLAVARDGQVVRQVETERPIGTPAVVGRLAFVPWSGQYVTVLDLLNGDETARVTLRDQTSHAWTQGGSLWFGELAFIRFDERIREASQGKASRATIPAREIPGAPQLMPAGEKPLAPAADAQDKVHLYARPQATDTGAAIQDDRWYATYFRLAMGFDARAGALAWVHLHGADFLGGAVAAGAAVLCDEQGKVVELDAKTGGVLSEVDLGEPLKACVVNADALRPSGAPHDVPPFVHQLSAAVSSEEPQLAVAQKLLLRELATKEDDMATRTLVDLASNPRTSPDLLVEARTALANRRNGAKYMEAALGRHYDYLKDVLRPPPVGPIAQALGAMKQTSAAPLLASHLVDPADTDDDVKRAAAALAVVATPAELPTLRQFFGMYRASAPNDDIAEAVVSVGQALLSLREASAVSAAATDATTVPYARERLEALVASLAAKPPPPNGPEQPPSTDKK
jgi:outer membrane protein assembly factor BamB